MLEIRVAVFCEVGVVHGGAEAFPEVGVLDGHRDVRLDIRVCRGFDQKVVGNKGGVCPQAKGFEVGVRVALSNVRLSSCVLCSALVFPRGCVGVRCRYRMRVQALCCGESSMR
jgi:hypothetical protein